jgi:hypothetical protein
MNIVTFLKNRLNLKFFILLIYISPAYALADYAYEYGLEDHSYYDEKHYDSEDEYLDYDKSDDVYDYDDAKETSYEDIDHHKDNWSDYIADAKTHFRKRFKEFFRYIRRIRLALKDPNTDWDSFDWGFDHHDDGHGDDHDEDHDDDHEEDHDEEHGDDHDEDHDQDHGDDHDEDHGDILDEDPSDNDGSDADAGDEPSDDTSMPVQSVSVSNQAVGYLGDNVEIELTYSTSDNDNQLSGLGLRVHYDSAFLTLNSLSDVLAQDNIVNGEGPISDADDLDNNPQTDSYISFGWASLFNNWPNAELPTLLARITFGVSSTIDSEVVTNTDINFTAITTTAGYVFNSESYSLELAETEATWDFDGNGNADALTDGLVMMRYSFGLRGDSMASNAIADDSQMSATQVEQRLSGSMKIADIDDDGNVDALTDGLLLLRHLFGLDNESLTHAALGHNASRKTKHALKHHLNKYMPKQKKDK